MDFTVQDSDLDPITSPRTPAQLCRDDAIDFYKNKMQMFERNSNRALMISLGSTVVDAITGFQAAHPGADKTLFIASCVTTFVTLVGSFVLLDQSHKQFEKACKL